MTPEQITSEPLAIIPGFADQALALLSDAVTQQVTSEVDYSLYVVKGRTAYISISGVLGPSSSYLRFYDGSGLATTYESITSAVLAANNDPEVEDITLIVQSPGGAFNGMGGAARTIRESTKPVTALVRGMAASAGYVLASQASQIVAESEASQVGSVGVVITMYGDDDAKHTFTSVPYKRMDPDTDHGKSAILEHLADLHNTMVDIIAKGRNIGTDKVNSDFGRGKVFLADKALSNQMVDSIGVNQVGVQKVEETPNTFTQADLDFAVSAAVEAERARCSQHLEFAAESGNYAYALQCVVGGTAIDASVMKEHLTHVKSQSSHIPKQTDQSVSSAIESRVAENPEMSSAAVEQDDGVSFWQMAEGV